MAYDIMRGREDSRDWSCGIDIKVKEMPSIMNKIDDVRYDLRRIGANVSGGVFALAGAFGALAFAKIYKTAQGRKDRKVA